MPLNPTVTDACRIAKLPSSTLPRPQPSLVAELCLDGRATLRSRSMHEHRSRTTRALSLLAVVFLLLLLIAAVSTIGRISTFGALHAQASWRGLIVAPERRCSPYDADNYRYPQSVEDRIVAELGGVYGPYTGRWFASKSDTDIEHMVARSEAHDSGLCAADLATRRRFATDLLNLTLAGPRVNRYEKVDRDAAEWLPAQNRCWFAARVIAVRQRYELTIDRREADALDQVLAGCSSTELITFARGEVPAAATSTVRVPEVIAAWDDKPQRPRQLRGSASARDRAGDARPSCVSVHAGR